MFRRIQAVLLIAEGRRMGEAAQITGLTLQSVYNLGQRYLPRPQIKSLDERPHTGRPPDAAGLTAMRIVQELRRSPWRLGYRTNVWTVTTLALQLSQRSHCAIAPWTLRRRMKHLGLVGKRPRYFYSEKPPHRAQKKGAIVRRLQHLPPEAVWLFEDETSLRLFPVLRRAWSLRGEQAIVPITGHTAKRVLFGTLTPRTGHRIVWRCRNMRHESFPAFLRLLRHAYPGRPIWLLLAEAPCHIAPKSQALAALLHLQLSWLPKQCSELNARDHLWRALKEKISANSQFPNIDEHAAFAEHGLHSLSDHEPLRTAGVLSKHFWLQSFLK